MDSGQQAILTHTRPSRCRSWLRLFCALAFLLPVNARSAFITRNISSPASKEALTRNKMSKKKHEVVGAVQPPRPHDNCYWVTSNFMAGEYPAAYTEEKTRQKLRSYLQCGITYFVDLTREGEKPAYQDLLQEEATKLGMGDVVVKRFGIPDFDIPDSPEQMKEILNAIDAATSQRHKVYVHCRGGIGRTGTTVGCYLARLGYTGEEALKEVNRLFKHSGRSMESYYSPETNDQMEFVKRWSE